MPGRPGCPETWQCFTILGLGLGLAVFVAQVSTACEQSKAWTVNPTTCPKGLRERDERHTDILRALQALEVASHDAVMRGPQTVVLRAKVSGNRCHTVLALRFSDRTGQTHPFYWLRASKPCNWELSRTARASDFSQPEAATRSCH